MGAFHTKKDLFYEVVPCKFCGDDTRRVTCSSQSCDHTVCVKERGVCFDCAREKLGVLVTAPPILTIHEFSKDEDWEAAHFDDAVRLLEGAR